MIKDLENLILAGKFTEAKRIIRSLSFLKLRDILLNIGFSSGSMTVYAFVCCMLIEEENRELHYLASLILSQAINHLEGAYSVALYHARRAVELRPDDVELKEYLLFFYEIPEGLITKEEATNISKEILKIKPTSKVASKVLADS